MAGGWSEQDVPDLDGKVAVVTGASAGLGLENTRVLAANGAHVVMATRDPDKTAAAADRVRRAVPGASLETVSLDLADLGSVARAAATIRDRYAALDIVVCNAGLMATPLRRTTEGFELQLGVNHLGHAAFVAQVLPAVLGADAGRIVVVSSEAHRIGRIDLDDLNFEQRRYERWGAYGQSKLANLLYVLELSRRLEGTNTLVAAAHPGYARTELQGKGPAMQGGLLGRVTGVISEVANVAFGQSPSQGALPQLYAATAPDVTNGSYWGPSGFAGARGAPGPADRSDAAWDADVARRLWDRTEALTGTSHDLAA